MTTGTPKTLTQAIQNGLDANRPGALEEHVLDFLRQHFGTAYLEMDQFYDDFSGQEGRPREILHALAQRLGVDKNANGGKR